MNRDLELRNRIADENVIDSEPLLVTAASARIVVRYRLSMLLIHTDCTNSDSYVLPGASPAIWKTLS